MTELRTISWTLSHWNGATGGQIKKNVELSYTKLWLDGKKDYWKLSPIR
jgi:hypothetical protein